ncbi:rpoE leader peptide RseD [Escherichia coli]|nr:rpoE leader peptide RseD [Escherichia coli]EME4639589.1 rpoE leader peptide RseD [Escherichia coli]MCQ5787066.1 rpoE leader peptide RseD [Escherichia coli]MCQ5811346.1 rpoE leader peptide RseD [Escherichia coli]MCQ5854233.1 rpoE leader peptide RseD [Escherichia coli]MCQ5888782.1 rpoE leader peptide RseD [Escherichia coli]
MIRLQHDKQKQMRYGTLQKRDTLTLCLLKLQLMEWRFDSA